MAANERVMEMVRKELQKNPAISSQDLFEKAKKLDSSMNGLSIRQFHASYPLQVKRLAKGGARGGRPRKVAGAGRRAGGTAGPGKRGRRAAKAAAATGGATTAGAPRGRRRRGRPPGRPRSVASGGAAGAAAPATAAPSASRSGGGDREAVRTLLLRFAGEVAAAEGTSDMLKVIGGMDSYVDRVMKAAAG
jgi:hypothetical protein